MNVTAEERAAAGAAFLDEKVPNWAERIEPAELDMIRCDRCVLGLLYGLYDNGFEQIVNEGHAAFGRNAHRARELGFLGHSASSFSGLDVDGAERADYRLLDKAWLHEIAKRVG